MLITGDTRHRILDGSGNPVVEGTVEVKVKDGTQYVSANLFRDIDLTETAQNPITLNSAGEIPFPVYVNAPIVYCFVKNKKGTEIRNYPVVGIGVPVKDNNNGTAQFSEANISTAFIENLHSDNAIINDLTVSYNATVNNLTVEKAFNQGDLIKTDGEKITLATASIDFTRSDSSNTLNALYIDVVKNTPIGSYVTGYKSSSSNFGDVVYSSSVYGSENSGTLTLQPDPPNNPYLKLRVLGCSGMRIELTDVRSYYFLCVVIDKNTSRD